MASKKPSGLGRGLGALLGDDVLKAESTGSLYLPISQVESCSSQPRKHFDEASLAELADSIREHGIIQPLTVRKLASGYYQIIAGERRWRAARLAGLQEVPVIVMEADDRKAAELAMIENLQREDLNPIEEAAGFQSLMETYHMTQELSLIHIWLRAGASGWRLDVADELPDWFLEKIRAAMEETAPDSVLTVSYTHLDVYKRQLPEGVHAHSVSHLREEVVAGLGDGLRHIDETVVAAGAVGAAVGGVVGIDPPAGRVDLPGGSGDPLLQRGHGRQGLDGGAGDVRPVGGAVCEGAGRVIVESRVNAALSECGEIIGGIRGQGQNRCV